MALLNSKLYAEYTNQMSNRSRASRDRAQARLSRKNKYWLNFYFSVISIEGVDNLPLAVTRYGSQLLETYPFSTHPSAAI